LNKIIFNEINESSLKRLIRKFDRMPKAIENVAFENVSTNKDCIKIIISLIADLPHLKNVSLFPEYNETELCDFIISESKNVLSEIEFHIGLSQFEEKCFQYLIKNRKISKCFFHEIEKYLREIMTYGLSKGTSFRVLADIEEYENFLVCSFERFKVIIIENIDFDQYKIEKIKSIFLNDECRLFLYNVFLPDFLRIFPADEQIEIFRNVDLIHLHYDENFKKEERFIKELIDLSIFTANDLWITCTKKLKTDILKFDLTKQYSNITFFDCCDVSMISLSRSKFNDKCQFLQPDYCSDFRKIDFSGFTNDLNELPIHFKAFQDKGSILFSLGNIRIYDSYGFVPQFVFESEIKDNLKKFFSYIQEEGNLKKIIEDCLKSKEKREIVRELKNIIYIDDFTEEQREYLPELWNEKREGLKLFFDTSSYRKQLINGYLFGFF